MRCEHVTYFYPNGGEDFACRIWDDEVFVYRGYEHFGTYELLREPFCHYCGYPGVKTENCNYHVGLYGFNRIYVMGEYSPRHRNLLSQHILKLKSRIFYAKPLGCALACTITNRYREVLKGDVLVPVPLHPTEYHERGFNQSLELARIVGKYLNISVEHVLKKKRVERMKGKNREARSRAVRGLYSIISRRENLVRNKYVVLIDDVITTGFTVSECSKVLRSNGADRVDVLGLARTVLI